jgi:uncharacterized protein YndB with AHSA1/START domain
VRIAERRELLASPEDVWSLLAEPRHLSDWWPGYQTVRPDRRGLASGARWQVSRSRDAGFLRRPGGAGMIVIDAVEPRHLLGWQDIEQGFAARLTIARANGHTSAELAIEAPAWRIVAEGLRSAPRSALARLHALCQTAATI